MRTFAREQNHGISCRSSCNGESEKWRSFYGAPHAMAGLKTSPTLLGDSRTDSRMLVLIGLALPVGAISAVVAKALLWLIFAYEDETLHDAIARMLRHDVGRLPVVDRANEKRIVGYLGCASIMAARERYHRDEQIRERGLRKSKLTELQKV